MLAGTVADLVTAACQMPALSSKSASAVRIVFCALRHHTKRMLPYGQTCNEPAARVRLRRQAS